MSPTARTLTSAAEIGSPVVIVLLLTKVTMPVAVVLSPNTMEVSAATVTLSPAMGPDEEEAVSDPRKNAVTRALGVQELKPSVPIASVKSGVQDRKFCYAAMRSQTVYVTTISNRY